MKKLLIKNSVWWILERKSDPAVFSSEARPTVGSQALVPVSHVVQIAVEQSVWDLGSGVDHPQSPFLLHRRLLQGVADVENALGGNCLAAGEPGDGK